jgi:hypothetical protein
VRRWPRAQQAIHAQRSKRSLLPGCTPRVAPFLRPAPRIGSAWAAPSSARTAWADINGDEEFPTLCGAGTDGDEFFPTSTSADIDDDEDIPTLSGSVTRFVDCSSAPRALSGVAPCATASGSPFACGSFPTVEKHTGHIGGGLNPEACTFSPTTVCPTQTVTWIALVTSLNETISILNRELVWHRSLGGGWADGECGLADTAGAQPYFEYCGGIGELREYVDASVGTREYKDEEASKEDDGITARDLHVSCLASLTECAQAKLGDVANALSVVNDELITTARDFTRRLDALESRNVAMSHTPAVVESGSAGVVGCGHSDAYVVPTFSSGSVVLAGLGERREADSDACVVPTLSCGSVVLAGLGERREADSLEEFRAPWTCAFCGLNLDTDLLIDECGSGTLCDECYLDDDPPLSGGRPWCAHELAIAKRADRGKCDWPRIKII